jgi:glycosyltransferase involved in cell wall biosynthesis
MRIAFLLPNYSSHVVGSALVYYRYANELVARGHEVDIFHPCIVTDEAGVRERIRSVAWSVAKSVVSRPVPWMEFPKGAKPRFRPRLEGLDLSHDVVIAFSWRMVEALDRIRFRGRAYGYIVEYETWAEADPARKARMETAYRKSLPMLCSSRIVESMLREVGATDVRSCILGVDVGRYAVGTPPEDRPRGRIGFPVRMEPVKSPDVLERTLSLLRERFGSDVSLWGFGHPGASAGIRRLLDEYRVDPSDEELAGLYGSSSIFAIPSRKEGFGIPAAEAMASGCAVVSTDNGGIRTFGVDGDNCVLVPPESPQSLADAIGALVEDPERRLELARRAPDSVRFLGWSEAGERFARGLEI